MNFADLDRECARILRDPVFLGALGEKVIDVIYKRVKSGKGVISDSSENPELKPLNKLSKRYVKYRKKVKLGEFGTPKKSNLTLTGQMLNNLISKAINNGVEISVDNTSRRRAIGEEEDSITNKKVAEYVSENGRPFLALAVKEQRIIVKFIDDYLTSQLRKFR